MRWILLTLSLFAAAAVAQKEVRLVDIDGPLGPATSDLIVRSIESANQDAVEAIILRMDTPGGLDSSMREIIQTILASEVPVISFVAPKGSRAASAGTYILYASHVAAMAPATNLGAATPVQLGGIPSMPEPAPDKDNGKAGDDKKTDNDDAKSSDQAMRNKVVNDARAYIRSLAELRGRNVEWAERAVTESATLTAKQALEANVIDLVAEDEQALLKALSEREVSMGKHTLILNTADATITVIEPDWRAEFLGVITNPSVAYILMLVGVYGLILEFYNPGIGAAGIIGAICLFVALYAMQLLPISYSALALMLLGLGLMAAEAFSPSFGVMGLGGIAAFIIGSIMLMDTDLPGFQIALPIILAFAAASAGMLFVVLSILLKARHKPVTTGMSTLEGKMASVVSGGEDKFLVRLDGELWHASCEEPVSTGDTVRVTGHDGLTLYVKRES